MVYDTQRLLCNIMRLAYFLANALQSSSCNWTARWTGKVLQIIQTTSLSQNIILNCHPICSYWTKTHLDLSRSDRTRLKILTHLRKSATCELFSTHNLQSWVHATKEAPTWLTVLCQMPRSLHRKLLAWSLGPVRAMQVLAWPNLIRLMLLSYIQHC